MKAELEGHEIKKETVYRSTTWRHRKYSARASHREEVSQSSIFGGESACGGGWYRHQERGGWLVVWCRVIVEEEEVTKGVLYKERCDKW